MNDDAAQSDKREQGWLLWTKGDAPTQRVCRSRDEVREFFAISIFGCTADADWAEVGVLMESFDDPNEWAEGTWSVYFEDGDIHALHLQLPLVAPSAEASRELPYLEINRIAERATTMQHAGLEGLSIYEACEWAVRETLRTLATRSPERQRSPVDDLPMGDPHPLDMRGEELERFLDGKRPSDAFAKDCPAEPGRKCATCVGEHCVRRDVFGTPSSEGTRTPEAFDLPHLDGPTPCTDELVNVKLGRLVALDPKYHYVQQLIEFTKGMERLFWRERKSIGGLMKLLAQARAERSATRERKALEACRAFIEVLARWEDQNGTLAAILPMEHATLTKQLQTAAMTASAREARNLLRDAVDSTTTKEK